MTKITLTIICCLCLFGAKAQIVQADKDEVTAQLKEKQNKDLYSPGKSTVFSNFSNVNITSDFGDASASALVAFSVGSSSSLSFYLKQPFETKPKKVTFFDKDGLSAGTSAEIAFQHIFWKPKVNDALFTKLKDAYAAKKGIAQGTAAYRGITVADFDDKTIADFWSDKGNDLGIPVLIGFGYAVAKNEIDYILDSFSVSPKNENRTNHNLRFTAGLYLKDRSVISLSAIQEIKFESGDPINRNFPLNSSGLSYNKDVTVGEPVKKNLTRIQLDYRKAFYRKGVISFAIAPSIAFRTSENSLAIELPLYFLNMKEEKKVKGLQGGISIGYTDKLKEKTTFNDGFAFNIFVGLPFDLFGYFRTR